MPNSEFKDLHIFLVALVDTKKNYVVPDESHPKLVEQLKGMLQRYNSYKADKFMDHPEFAYLVLRFLKDHDISGK